MNFIKDSDFLKKNNIFNKICYFKKKKKKSDFLEKM